MLILVCGIIFIVVGIAFFKSNIWMLLLVALGIIFLLWAFRRDNHTEKMAEEDRQSRIKQRVTELTECAWDSHRTLAIKGSTVIPFIVVAILGSVVSLFLGLTRGEILWVIASGAFLFLMVVRLLTQIPLVGKPVIILDANGFQTPLYGYLRWQNIAGICLNTFESKGQTIYTLQFLVSNIGPVLEQMHWSKKFLAPIGLGTAKSKIVAVPLRHTNQEPEVVLALARFLHQAKTGKASHWNPMLSKQCNEAAARVNAFTDQYPDFKQFEEKMALDPEGSQQVIQQFMQDMITIKKEQARSLRRVYWTIGICLAGLLLSFAWPAISSFF